MTIIKQTKSNYIKSTLRLIRTRNSTTNMGNATSISDQPTGISPEAFEALRNEYEAQKKAEPVLTGDLCSYQHIDEASY